MGFLDKFRSNKSAQLPRNAKVVRRTRWNGTQDTGYWHMNTFYLLDGTATDSGDYKSGDERLSTSEARSELAEHGYSDADNYYAPSSSSSYDSGSTGYSGSSYSDDSGSRSYGGGSSYDSGYSSGGSSYDSGSSSSGSSYSSGSSSSSSYDSGSSSSSSSDSGSY